MTLRDLDVASALAMAIALVECASPVHAQSAPSRPSEKCLSIASRVASAVAGTAEIAGSEAVAIQVRTFPPKVFDMRLMCPPGKVDGIDPRFLHIWVMWDRHSPPPVFWEVAGASGAVITGAKKDAVIAVAQRCVAKALSDPSVETGEAESKNIRVECHAFTRDGGGNIVMIYAPQGWKE